MGFLDELGEVAGGLLGGTQVFSGIAGANAADRAADQQAAGQRKAMAAQREMFDLVRADTEYQRQAGRSATDALLSMVGLPGLAAPMAPAAAVVPQSKVSRFAQSFMGRRNRSGQAGGPSLRDSGYGPFRQASLVAGEEVPALMEYGYEPRARGGRNFPGRRYLLSEYGQPEATTDIMGNTTVTTQPTAVTANTPSVTTPLSQMGNPIPGSNVTENPGGQPGRYNFMTDPGYGFRFDEGQRAIERSAAARGMGLSGSVLKELSRYGQGIASQEYGNVYGRLAGIANLGQGASNMYGQAAMGTGQGLANAYGNIGSAQAAGTLGRNSAYAQMSNNLLQGVGMMYGGIPGLGSMGAPSGATPGAVPGQPGANGGWGEIDWSGMLPYGGTP